MSARLPPPTDESVPAVQLSVGRQAIFFYATSQIVGVPCALSYEDPRLASTLNFLSHLPVHDPPQRPGSSLSSNGLQPTLGLSLWGLRIGRAPSLIFSRYLCAELHLIASQNIDPFFGPFSVQCRCIHGTEVNRLFNATYYGVWGSCLIFPTQACL